VGGILALYKLKSPSLDYKAKLKLLCFFLHVAPFFANNLRFMVKLIDEAIVLCNQFKIHKKRFYSSNKEILSF
jgi:hypothetical protein